MNYPRLDPEDWKNARLTVKEREEVNYMVNTANISVTQLAKTYNVCQSTILYWSDPIYRHLNIEKANARKERKLATVEGRRKIIDQQVALKNERYQNDEMFRAWVKSSKKGYIQTLTTEQKERNKEGMKSYYRTHKEYARERRNRSYRKKNFNGFRMFMARFEA